MSEFEYQALQERFTAKLKNHRGYASNKEDAYNKGVLACKSILKEVFERQQKQEASHAD
jgi:hypothetical protein